MAFRNTPIESLTAGERGLSGSIWGRFPTDYALTEKKLAEFYFEDFTNAQVFATTVSQNGLYTFQDSSVTVKGVATEPSVIKITTPATTNSEGILTTGGNFAPFGRVSSTDKKSFLWEARFKVGQITNHLGFIGVGVPGLAVTDGILTDTTGALTDNGVIGFHVAAASGSALNAVYKKNGQTAQTSLAAAATLVADTFVKVGVAYDAPKGILEFHVNGVAVSRVTDVSAATFPDGVWLALYANIKALASTAATLTLDWWAAGYMYQQH